MSRRRDMAPEPAGRGVVLDFPFARVAPGPVGLPMVTLGNFSPAVARRLAAALERSPVLR